MIYLLIFCLSFTLCNAGPCCSKEVVEEKGFAVYPYIDGVWIVHDGKKIFKLRPPQDETDRDELRRALKAPPTQVLRRLAGAGLLVILEQTDI